jgi:hypothetical protein
MHKVVWHSVRLKRRSAIMGITRRDFAALGGITLLVTLTGCGGEDDEGDFLIGGNHANGAHRIFLPASDLASTVDKTYSIAGDAQHNHFVTFTVAQLQQLQAGQRIEAISSVDQTDLHIHQVTVFEPADD